jgi:5-methylcytosine-specific restriction protein A
MMNKTLSSLTERKAITKAIDEYDRIGRESFLKKYGFGKAKNYYLLHRGKHYDSKAITGAAFRYQFGKPLIAKKFSGGKATVFPKLKSLGFHVVATAIDDDSSALPEEVPGHFPEGTKRQIFVNAFERNAQARVACIEYHGSCCIICGFDFGKIYGEKFEGHIHVHHLKPLSMRSKKRNVNPKTDLIPVCPNCHAVIHLGNKTRSIRYVKGLIKD